MKREVKATSSVEGILSFLDAAIKRHPSFQGKVVENQIGDENTNPTTLDHLGEK